MSVLKYKDPVTGEVKTVGAPSSALVEAHNIDPESHSDIRESVRNAKAIAESKAPMYSYGTADLTPGVSPLASGTLYFVYE